MTNVDSFIQFRGSSRSAVQNWSSMHGRKRELKVRLFELFVRSPYTHTPTWGSVPVHRYLKTKTKDETIDNTDIIPYMYKQREYNAI